jgi:hypothetical protein
MQTSVWGGTWDPTDIRVCQLQVSRPYSFKYWSSTVDHNPHYSPLSYTQHKSPVILHICSLETIWVFNPLNQCLSPSFYGCETDPEGISDHCLTAGKVGVQVCIHYRVMHSAYKINSCRPSICASVRKLTHSNARMEQWLAFTRPQLGSKPCANSLT